MTLPETSPAMSTAEHLMSSVELWGTEYETAGRLGVAPGTATTDEPTDVAAVAGRWALTLGAAEEHARHLREAWALPILVAWSDETAEA